METTKTTDRTAGNTNNSSYRNYDRQVTQKFEKAQFEHDHWEIDDESVILLWKEANALSQMCKEINFTSKEEAEKNMLGFQYGDRFVRY